MQGPGRQEPANTGPLIDDWFDDLVDFVYGGRQDTAPWFEWLDLFGPRVPVGSGSPFPNIVVPQITFVPPLDAGPAPGTTTSDLGETIGTTPTPNQTELQEVAVSWGDYASRGGVLPSDWNSYPMASDHPLVEGIYEAPVIVETGDSEVGILGDIYDVIDTGLGGILPGGVPVGGPTVGPTTLPVYNQQPTGTGTVLAPTLPVPGVPTVTTACGDNDPMKGMVYKKVCGQYKWVKQKRRRRRALATKGDLSQLASLKGVLGQGKAFEVWIATHS